MIKLEQYAVQDENAVKKIDGIGKDAEIVTNEKGGKQSKSPMAMHLLDPEYLKDVFEDMSLSIDSPYNMTELERTQYELARAGMQITDGMIDPVNIINCIDRAMYLIQPDLFKQITEIAKVLQYGAERYAVNNWRLIPQEEHINHALIHLIAAMMGDTQDDHINHCLTRLMMARATEQSEGFSYTEYIGKGE